eukprot:c10953_g1_i2.p1 GENE.c10953_g1_i2~~c10953_g1_i2.p1  ORF type:complete len:356 (+),score=61.49 c10953_g1_i2:316-1383(+)
MKRGCCLDTPVLSCIVQHRSAAERDLCDRRAGGFGIVCACQPGWTGTADFVAFLRSDCDIHTPTIQAAYIITVCLAALNMIVFLLIFFARLDEAYDRNHKTLKQAILAPQVVTCFYFVISSALLLSVFLQKLVHVDGVEHALIGHDVSITIRFVLALIGFEIAIISVAANMKHVTADVNTHIKINFLGAYKSKCVVLFWFATLLTVSCKLILVAMAFVDSPNIKDSLLLAHLILVSAFLPIVFSLAIYQNNLFIKALQDSLMMRQQHVLIDNTADVIRAKIQRFRLFRAFIIPTFAFIPICLLFSAIWPFMRRKAVYTILVLGITQITYLSYAFIITPWNLRFNRATVADVVLVL